MTVVAMYTRLSQADPETQTGTRRQEEACRAFIHDRGWLAGPVFEDVDVSAFSGVPRPAYERLLLAIELGEVDGVVFWKLDRLTRRMSEFERFWKVCEAHGTMLASVTEPLDSSSDLGMAMVRILITFAVLESATMGARLQAMHKERAFLGLPPNTHAAYGFNRGWTKVVPREAAVIREAAKRVLDGESRSAIARDLTARAVPSPGGSTWTTATLGKVLCATRLTGDRTYHGETVCRDCFPQVLDRLTFERVGREILLRSLGRLKGLEYELSGMVRCGTCGSRMAGSRQDGNCAYVCYARNYGTPCFTSIRCAPVEELVKRAVLDRLDRQSRAGQRDAVAASVDPVALAGAYERYNARLRALSHDHYVRRFIDRSTFLACRDELEQELDRSRRELGDPTLRPPVPRDVGRLQRSWRTLDLRLKRTLLKSEIEMIRVSRRTATSVFDPSRVDIIWWEPEVVGAKRSRLKWPTTLPVGYFHTAEDLGTIPPVARGVSRTRSLTCREVAPMLGVTEQQVQRLTRAGKINGQKVGMKYFYSPADVQLALHRFRIVSVHEWRGAKRPPDRQDPAGHRPAIVTS